MVEDQFGKKIVLITGLGSIGQRHVRCLREIYDKNIEIHAYRHRNLNQIIDDELKKPQAFHTVPTSIAGGMGIFFSLLIVHFYFLLFKDIFFFEYLTFCTLFFILGFIDDIKINI